jgi:hypothetical protein
MFSRHHGIQTRRRLILKKWQIPSCIPCNNEYGKIENDFLIRVGLALTRLIQRQRASSNERCAR